MKESVASLLLLCIPGSIAACQELDTGAASGGNTFVSDTGAPLGDAGAPSPQALGLIQCEMGSPECFALCGSPSCALLDAAIPPELASPVFYLPDGAAVTDPCLAVEADSVAIRQRACAPCHQDPQRQGGFSDVLDDAKLANSVSNVAMDDAGMHLKMVVPGDPEHSFVYERVMLGQMPPPMSLASSIIGSAAAKKLVYPNAADETVLYAWIMCLGAGDGGPYAATYAGATYGPGPDGGGLYLSSSGVGSSGASGSSSGGPASSGASRGSSRGSSGSSSGAPASSGGSSGSSSGAPASSGGSSGSSSGAAAVDAAQYNFEQRGFRMRGAQGWTSSGPPIVGVGTSMTQVFAGSQSLAVDFNGPAGTAQALVSNPGIPAGAVVTFHVWIPAGSAITAVQPFVQEAADSGFAIIGPSTPIANLTVGAWNTLTVTIPANTVTPLRELGVQFVTNAMWIGTVYLDSIGW